MKSVYVKMFDIPGVFINNEKVVFPFKKAEALFYYIVVNGETTRDEAAALLWPDTGDETARKNLRDAIYKIKKAVGMDIIVSPHKSVIMLNPEIKIESDLTDIDSKIDSLYPGEFLKGFSLKDGEAFDEWIISRREYYRNIHIKKLYSALYHAVKENRYEEAEACAGLIIGIDRFDEKAYRTLMRIYTAKGMYNKAIDLYSKLSEILSRELGITPDAKTKLLIDKILAIKASGDNKGDKRQADFFYGREKELQILEKNYRNFIDGRSSKSFILIGEAGIGKTRLKDKLLKEKKEDRVCLMETNCYQAEERYFLKPWNAIIEKINAVMEDEGICIPDGTKKLASRIFPVFSGNAESFDLGVGESMDNFKYQTAENAVVEIIKRVSGVKRLLLVFEDIQWADDMSLSLLSNILLHCESKNVCLISTCRNGYGKRIDRFITLMSKYNKIERMEIKRFTESETADFIKKALPGYKFTPELEKKIYGETEGNTFFIIECLNSISKNGRGGFMSSRAEDILRSRFVDISEDGMKMLGIISMFFDEAPINLIKRITGKDDIEIMDIVEELEDRYIISETNDSGYSAFKFTHQKLREYVYMQQSPARKKILHKRIGDMLEEGLKGDAGDVHIYSKLIYHYYNAGDKLSVLKYSIKNINVFLDISHELYPVLARNDSSAGSCYANLPDIKRHINEIETLLYEVKNEGAMHDMVLELEAEFLHIKGRFMIRYGEYEKGILCINKMIDISKSTGNIKMILKGYRQMVYYCIQTYNASLMEEYIEKALSLAKEKRITDEAGILLRLSGLNRMMVKDFLRAEELLKESINTLSVLNHTEDVYSLNIAAAYNYIGEIRRKSMRFSSALYYYDKAISICREKTIFSGIPVFNANAGQAAFELGDYERSKAYFENSIKLFDKVDSIWGRSIAEGFMALLLIKEGNYSEAKKHLEKADFYSEKLKSPQEIGIISRIKAEIKVNMKNNPELDGVFKDYLTEDVENYCSRGIELLEKVKETYEIDILKMFKRIS